MTWWRPLLFLAAVACAAPADEDAAASRTSALASDDFAHWSEVLGGAPKRPTVIGVRKSDPRVAPVFDDRIVVVLPDGRVTTFAGSTHPWFESNAAATDGDHDGVPDVGMLKPGRYKATRKGTHFGAPKYAVAQTDGRAALPGWRNTDHDDRYSDEEKAASERRGDLLTDILVHAAGEGSLPPIGCQVLAPKDMNALSKLVGDTFDYVLIDGP